MIICGDFGGVWDGSKKDERMICVKEHAVRSKSYTALPRNTAGAVLTKATSFINRADLSARKTGQIFLKLLLHIQNYHATISVTTSQEVQT